MCCDSNLSNKQTGRSDSNVSNKQTGRFDKLIRADEALMSSNEYVLW